MYDIFFLYIVNTAATETFSLHPQGNYVKYDVSLGLTRDLKIIRYYGQNAIFLRKNDPKNTLKVSEIFLI